MLFGVTGIFLKFEVYTSEDTGRYGAKDRKSNNCTTSNILIVEHLIGSQELFWKTGIVHILLLRIKGWQV